MLVILGLLQIILVVGVGVSTVLYLLGIYSAFEFFGRRRNLAADTELPPVSILKPLKGADVELYQNLLSLCTQDYQKFQLLCGVAKHDDPAINTVRQLQKEFPRLDIDLVVDERVYGTNYKVSNLHNLYQYAKHDVIVLADSDIRVAPDHLRRLVPDLRKAKVGIVTCLYRAVNRGGLPTLVESLFINTDFAALVLLARKIERPTYAFGATMAMRREVLDEIGGFLAITNHLADDYELGNRVAAKGYDLVLTDQVVETVIALGSWRRLFEHQLRWARTYRICRPGGYFGSFVTHGTFWAVANVLFYQFSALSVFVSSTALAVRHLSAVLIARRFMQAKLGLREFLLIVPKDLFITLCWFLAFAGGTVGWSGRRFRVSKNGEMIDLSPGAPEPLPAEMATLPFVESPSTGTHGK